MFELHFSLIFAVQFLKTQMLSVNTPFHYTHTRTLTTMFPDGPPPGGPLSCTYLMTMSRQCPLGGPSEVQDCPLGGCTYLTTMFRDCPPRGPLWVTLFIEGEHYDCPLDGCTYLTTMSKDCPLGGCTYLMTMSRDCPLGGPSEPRSS